jgi:hydrogenase maturation protein HypF
VTTSAGRLFDAAASLLGLRQRSTYEGQAAMELEFAARAAGGDEVLPVAIVERVAGVAPVEVPEAGATPAGVASAPRFVLDWAPLVRALLDGLAQGRSPGALAAGFHNGLAEGILEVAQRVGQERVVLTGGCFQNRVLTERAVRRLQAGGFRVYWHQRVPPNDGGIALGQAVVAGARGNLEGASSGTTQ